MESFWEAVSGSSLRQGDYLLDCPVPIFQLPPDETGQQTFRVGGYDLIVLTQSCDLENEKIELVATCPIFPLANYEAVNPSLAKKGRWEEVRKGRVEGLHLLSSPLEPADNRASLVIDFRKIYSLPFALLTEHAGASASRWRLKSPYLEHFSQAFARFFMRVGLPASIPPFK